MVNKVKGVKVVKVVNKVKGVKIVKVVNKVKGVKVVLLGTDFFNDIPNNTTLTLLTILTPLTSFKKTFTPKSAPSA